MSYSWCPHREHSSIIISYAVTHAARRYNGQPSERSQARQRTVDNTSLRRLTQVGRYKKTAHPRVGGYVDGGVGRRGGACSPRTTGRWPDVTNVCGVSGRNVSGPRWQRAIAPEGSTVSGPQRQRRLTSERRYVNSRNVRGPQRESDSGVTSACRNVRAPQRQSGATSASRSV